MNQLVFIAALLLLVITFAHCTTIPCGTGTCPSSTGCCVWTPSGATQLVNQCFDKSQFICTPDQSNPHQNCLCASGLKCCNKACFNPSQFACVTNNGNNGNTCLCPIGQSCCNGHCYDANTKICLQADNNPSKRCLCQAGVHDRCFYDASNQPQCYSSTTNPVCTSNPNIQVSVQAALTSSCRIPIDLQCSVSGVTGPVSYSWSTPNGIISGLLDALSVKATTSGEYICTVSIGGCSYSASKIVSISNLAAIVTPSTAHTCSENAEFSCPTTGAVGPVSRSWTTSGGSILGDVLGNIITGTTTGSYICSVTDALCSATAFASMDATSCSCPRFEIELSSLLPGCSTGKTGVKAKLEIKIEQLDLNAVLKLKIDHPLDSILSKIVGVGLDLPTSAPKPTYKPLRSIFTKLWTSPLLAPYGKLSIGMSPANSLFDLLGISDGLQLGATSDIELLFPNTNAEQLSADIFAGLKDGSLRAVAKFQLPGLLGILPVTDKVLGKVVRCLV